MTKISKSYSIELMIVDKIEKLCLEKNISPSSLINSLLNEWIKDQDIFKIKILKCEKCNTEYSSKLSECPNCLIDSTKSFIIQTQKQIEEEEKEKNIVNIMKRKNEITDTLRQYRYTYNRLLIEDRGQEALEIKIQIEDMEKELANINNLLGV